MQLPECLIVTVCLFVATSSRGQLYSCVQLEWGAWQARRMQHPGEDVSFSFQDPPWFSPLWFSFALGLIAHWLFLPWKQNFFVVSFHATFTSLMYISWWCLCTWWMKEGVHVQWVLSVYLKFLCKCLFSCCRMSFDSCLVSDRQMFIYIVEINRDCQLSL